MIRLKIEALKAPWPQGAAVGDVVDLDAQSIPDWALGKCHVTDEAVTLWHGEAVGDGAGVALPEITANVVPAGLVMSESVEADPVAEAEAQATEERAAIDTKAALVEKAKALGLDIDGRWSEKRLAQEVAKAEAKA